MGSYIHHHFSFLTMSGLTHHSEFKQISISHTDFKEIKGFEFSLSHQVTLITEDIHFYVRYLKLPSNKIKVLYPYRHTQYSQNMTSIEQIYTIVLSKHSLQQMLFEKKIVFSGCI